ncbi:MAG: roadblock/LC7 domain-containing protein [Verrucomicrobiae bacterium]|jgi:predicted regulator of Ras-like GTPase activity (Roadblock/LC7/MglB family)|nr:roadblock/LC7 domain-containing protein [Verrucomicrobiae bacterium]
MATLPQLVEEDISKLDETLHEFLAQTDALIALVIDKGGFLITHQGEAGEVDLTTLGALASGAFMASQTIAGLVNEQDFNHTSLQGGQFSLYTTNIDIQCLLVVVFPSKVGVGVVKYYSGAAVARLAQQLAIARERDPVGGLDLSEMNVANPEAIFRKKTV